MRKSFTQMIGAFSSLIIILLFSATSVNGQYCSASATYTGSEYITNVTFSGIENTTGSTSYSDFTDMSAYVVPGVSYPFSSLIANGSSNTYTEYLAVYIDWNQDETFSEDERTSLGSCSGTACSTTGISGMIDVPHNALPGPTRMRVIMNYNNPVPGPCGTVSWGEVEDYTVEVQVGECTPPDFEY